MTKERPFLLPLQIGAACLVVLGAVWAGLLFEFDRWDRTGLDQAQRDVTNLATGFREDIRRMVGAIDQLMIIIIDEQSNLGSGPRIPKWLDNSPLLKGTSLQVAIIGPDGLLQTSSLPSSAKVDLSDRPHFRYHLDPTASQPFISVPVLGRVSGKWSIQITRRIVRPDGSFGGVVVVSVDPLYFSRFFDSINLGRDGVIVLAGLDGIIRARRSAMNHDAGQSLSGTPFLQHLREADSGNYVAASKVDGVERLYGFSKIPDYPLAVSVGMSTAEVYADAQRFRMIGSMAGAAMSVIVLALAWLLVREINRRRSYSDKVIRRQKIQLEVAVNNMTQGLLLFDSAQRIVICNGRYIQMYGLSPDIVQPGCTLRKLIEHRKETGSLKDDIDAYYKESIEHVSQGMTTQSIIETTDGRSIQITHHPLPDGGWVSTHEEITERWKLEQERDRNQAFLNEIIENIPARVIVKNARDLTYRLINRAAEEQLGMPRAEVIGKTAYDFYSKDTADWVTRIDRDALVSDGAIHMDEHEFETPGLGRRYVVAKRICIRDQFHEPQYVISLVNDVTERKRLDERITYLAQYDELTNLPNRSLFRDRLERALESVTPGNGLAVLYIDIDEFKNINDSLGHQVGDSLLKIVAERLRRCLGSDDFAARLGGDEFAIVNTSVTSRSEVAGLVHRIQSAIQEACQCDGHQLIPDASIGVAMAPDDASEIDELLKCADLAMYAAKSAGHRTCRFFERAMADRAAARQSLELDLRNAIANQELEVHYQPLVSLRSDAVTGCEALLRWRHPRRGMISPAEFIPIAEASGLILQLGDWVLKTACREAATWPSDTRIAVNVSPLQFRNQSFGLTVAAALAAAGLRPNRLELEITEAVLIQDDSATQNLLDYLRSLGVRISLDDFGTGFSSLSYLHRFVFDKVKIDRSFVKDIVEPGTALPIVQAIVAIAAARDMTTTAEGVETEAQREALRDAGCDEMQGFLFSKPIPSEQLRSIFDRSVTTLRPTLAI